MIGRSKSAMWRAFMTSIKRERGGYRDYVCDVSSSKKVLPLQAADLLAWEIYQDSIDSLNGRTEREGPRRRQLRRLIESGRVRVEYCRPEGVRRLAQHGTNPVVLAELAKHVDFE